MIIVPESHVRKTRPDRGEHNVLVTTEGTPLISDESPPAYTPREHPTASSSSAPPNYNPQPSPETQKRPLDPAVCRRFSKAFVLALFLYATIAFIFKFLIMSRGPPPHHNQGVVGYPEPGDGTIVTCVWGRDIPGPPPHPVRFPPLSIPLHSSAIFVIARGQQATGKVNIVLDEAGIADEIMVDITAKRHHPDVLMSTTACLLEKGGDQFGVGLFTPNRPIWTSRKAEFEIMVKIPYRPLSPVLQLPRLEILATNFEVSLPDLDKFVQFQDIIVRTGNGRVTAGSSNTTNIDIRSSNAQVAIDSVYATNIDIRTSNANVTLGYASAAKIGIRTSNGSINGTFVTNSSLSLETSNASIKANISLENDPVSEEKTLVRATTSNGSLTGAISLLSDGGAPRYAVHAKTSNAALDLSFLQEWSGSSQPSLPILDIVGTTSNGQAKLLLQSPFEGSFGISTSSSPADFLLGSGPKEDPLGLGRKQNVELETNAKSEKQGRVYWGDLDDGRELGRVKLSTSNALASLHI